MSALSRLSAWLRGPWIWLLLQALCVAFLQHRGGELSEPAIPNNDTSTYLELDLSSPQAVLTSFRTVGFPVFIQGLRAFSSDLAWLPGAHLATWCLAVFIMVWGLRLFLGSGWRALLMASPLLWASNFLGRYNDHITADVTGAAFGMATIGALFAVLGRPRSAWTWGVLTFLLAATYHIRPAYLYLLPLVPVLGMALAVLVPRRGASVSSLPRGEGLEARAPRLSSPNLLSSGERGSLGLGHLAIGLVLAAALPFFAWCSLRWVAVGHFGLVSFGGLNTIGIAGQWLDEETIAALPEHLEPLAREIVARRAEVPDWQPPTSYAAMNAMYNHTIWRMAEPAAMDLYDGDWVLVNTRLKELSSIVLRRYPGRYLRWVWSTFNICLREALRFFATERVTQTLVLLLGVLHLVWLALARWLAGAREGGGPTVDGLVPHRAISAAVLAAAGFLIAKILLVSLVEQAHRRYFLAAGVLLPLLPGAAMVWYVDRVRALLLFLRLRQRRLPL